MTARRCQWIVGALGAMVLVAACGDNDETSMPATGGASGQAGSGPAGAGGTTGSGGTSGAGGAEGGAAGAGGIGGFAPSVDKQATGMSGKYYRVAAEPAGPVHLVYIPESGGGVRYARYASGTWTTPATLPGSTSASQWWFNLPVIAVDASAQPHVLFGPGANPANPGIWHWNGASNETTQIYHEYTEFVTIGISTTGSMMVGAGVIYLPNATEVTALASAELVGNTLGAFEPFAGTDSEVKSVTFCSGGDGSLHLVGRLGHVNYARWEGAAWGPVERIGVATQASAALGMPACVVDDAGDPAVAWLQWLHEGTTWRPVDVRFAARHGGSWTPTEQGSIIAPVLATQPFDASAPTLARSPTGRLMMAWVDELTNVYLARSTDGGATFSPPVLAVDDFGFVHHPPEDIEFAPLFFSEGSFQLLYRNTSGALVRAIIQD